VEKFEELIAQTLQDGSAAVESDSPPRFCLLLLLPSPFVVDEDCADESVTTAFFIQIPFDFATTNEGEAQKRRRTNNKEEEEDADFILLENPEKNSKKQKKIQMENKMAKNWIIKKKDLSELI
jgi:hypothetical protein